MPATDPISKRIRELWRNVRKAEKNGDGRLAATYSRHLNDLLLKQESSGIPLSGEGDAHSICLSCLDKVVNSLVPDSICPACGKPSSYKSDTIAPRPINVH